VLRAGVTYVAGAAPFVASFSPTSGPTAGGTTVTIQGSGFDSNATVRFGTAAATGVSVVSATQIVCVAPAQTGAVEVRVTNPSTGLTGVSTTLYSYGDAPVIPSSGGSSSGCALAPTGDSPRPLAAAALGLLGLLLVRRRRR
jgi:large repetitive protein